MSFFIGNSVVITSIGGMGGSEKSNYGKETVDEDIDVSGSLRLNGTTVHGTVDAGGSINAVNAQVQKLDAGGSINITRSLFQSLGAGGSITIVESQGKGKADAGGSITANRCKVLGPVKAGGSANLDDCESVQSVIASSVSLTNTNVVKDVSASEIEINNSKIGGKLTCAGERMVISSSTIDTIIVKSRTVMGKNSFMVVNNGSVSMFSGSGNVIINGVPLSSAVQQAAQAPTTKQVLELQEGCQVRNIVFEGGKGEVVLKGKSLISGSVTGGKVVKASEGVGVAASAGGGAGEGGESVEAS